MCSSSVGARSGIFKVSSDINCIPSATEKQLTHSLSLPIAPLPISPVGYGDVVSHCARSTGTLTI